MFFVFLADGFWLLFLFSVFTTGHTFGLHVSAIYIAGMLILLVWRLTHGWMRRRRSHPLLG